LVGFVTDCIQWRAGEYPTPYQLDACKNLPIKRRYSIRGPHGLGKTALAAWVVLWFALTRDGRDWKIPTTASAWRQLVKFLWPEIRKWSRRLRWDVIGRGPFSERNELLTQSLKLKTGEAFALASDNAAMLEGAHATNILYLFDEAKTIPPDTWDAAEGAMSVGDAYWLAISTPGEPNGRFYEIHKRAPGYDDWAVRHVTRDETIAAGQMSEAWAEQRRKQWGEASAVYQNRVSGEFASSDEDGVIPLSSIELANERWQVLQDTQAFGEITHVGADIGRGGDLSVLAIRCGVAVMELRKDAAKDTMIITGKLAGLLSAHRKAKALIDVIGIGAGVVDRLREMPKIAPRVIPFNAGARTDKLDSSGELGFVDMRSAGWWTLRELLMDENSQMALPPDDKLTGDMTAAKWREMSGGKIKVESKDDIRKRLGRSTDDGDAVMMAFANIETHSPRDMVEFV